MSRIGKLPIQIPDGVEVIINKDQLTISGPKGSLEKKIPASIEAKVVDSKLIISSKGKSKQDKSLYGSYRAHFSNMVNGVSSGWSKVLELVGTGYRASVEGGKLILLVGFSHPVEVDIPKELAVSVEKSEITIEGIDIELVGLFAARVRAIRPPEPYKGKGIRYKEEQVRRKAGKAAKTAAA